MNNNEALINLFYTCFQNRNYKGMQDCYSDDAVFSDPVFTNLDAKQVRAMWQMLIEKGKDLQLSFTNVTATETSGSAQWTATYTFSATGRKVVNLINASFVFANGKIIEHKDDFNFYRWAGQALGLKGWLLGFTPLLKNKVRESAMNSLNQYMLKA